MKLNKKYILNMRWQEPIIAYPKPAPIPYNGSEPYKQ